MEIHRNMTSLRSESFKEECSENLTKGSKMNDDAKKGAVQMDARIFQAVTPMLSKRLDVTDVNKLPANKTYQVESKFDGERFQVHMENGVFDYFSRGGHSVVRTFGSTYDEGSLTPDLKGCFSENVTSFILDGEMMGWHKDKHCFGSRGMKFDIKKIQENCKFRPCFCAFDVLYYNGKSLVGPPETGGLPLAQRVKLLDVIFTDIPGVIQRSKRQIVENKADILHALNQAIENQDEGIVVKDTQSYYVSNQRNAGWHKIKPEYTEGAMTDLDLVIIGAYKPKTKNQGRVRSFLVACADEVASDGKPQRWVCMGSVSMELKVAERDRVCDVLETHWTSIQESGSQPPPELVFNKAKPDFWVMPEHSLVLQVQATELVHSPKFGTGYTMRSARVVSVRDDKPVHDILTLEELKSLVASKGPVVKLSTNKIKESQIGDSVIKDDKKSQVTNELVVTPKDPDQNTAPPHPQAVD